MNENVHNPDPQPTQDNRKPEGPDGRRRDSDVQDESPVEAFAEEGAGIAAKE